MRSYAENGTCSMQTYWLDVRVLIVRRIPGWITVKFQESCGHFTRGEVVTLSKHNIKTPVVVSINPGRTPVIVKRTPYVDDTDDDRIIGSARKNKNIPDDPIECLDDLLAHFNGLIHWIAINAATHNRLHFLLSIEDLVSEMKIEVIKGWQIYGDKPEVELVRIVKKMINVRFKRLIYQFHITWRKDDANVLSLDPDWHTVSDGQSDPQDIEESSEKVVEFFKSLDEDEGNIVRAILGDNPNMQYWIQFEGMKRNAAFKNGHVKIGTDLVANVLHMDRKIASKVWSSIRKKWRQTYAK